MDPSVDKPRLAVIFGGRSSEHGVSCLTAREVLAVIDRDKYDVQPIGITPDGAWVSETAEWPDLEPGSLPAVRGDMPAFHVGAPPRLRCRVPAAARTVG